MKVRERLTLSLSVYPTHYIWIDTVIIDKCIDPKVNPNDLLTDQIAFPYMGITTSAYVTPVPTDDSSGYASFFSLIGAPSDCTLVPTGAPYALQPVTALTATSTITPSILPGQNPSDRPTNVVPTGPFWLAPVTGGFSLITTSSQRIEAPSPTPPKEPLHPEPAITTTPIPALSPTPPREPLHPAPAVTNTPVPPLSPQQPVDGPVTQPDNGGTRPVLPDITIGGSIVSPNTAGAYVVASQTLKPGGQITVSGTPISLVPSATAIVVAGITQPVHPAVQPSPAVVTINGFPVTPNAASQYVVGTQTVMPGAPAVTISGTPYSIAPLPSYTVVGGTTHQGTVVGGTTYQQTVVGGTTYQLPPAPPNLPTPTIGGTIVTPNGAGAYIVASQTLVPGGSAITVSGTRYSLASGDSYLVVGSVTETFASQTTASGLGGYIISGLGASPTAAGGGGRTNITMFTGGTSSLSRSRKAVAAGVVVVGGFAMVW